nr:hypothetical protein [Tanacetum cinerariifolium]
MVSLAPQDKWSQDKHIELVYIIGDPGAGMLTRVMAKELSVASAHEYLFVEFLSEKEPKKVSKALKHLVWVDAMQEELNQFGRNKVWTLVPVPYVARLEAIRIFIAIAIYMNFIIYQMDMKSAFLNRKLKEEVYVKQPPGFESNEYPNHVGKLDKALYKIKQAPRAYENTMVPPNNLRPNLNGKAVNETRYKGMIGSLMYLTASRPDTEFSTCLYARYQAKPKESHLIVVKRIFRYLKGACQLLGGKLVCWSAKKQYLYFVITQGAIAISNNLVLHSRTKYIDIRYHFIRDHILKEDIELHFIPTQYQLADIFTKPLDEPTFKRLICELETPPPFEPAPQGGFDIGEITFNPNNEVALIHPSHNNNKYFKLVLDFISKCCLRETFTRSPNQYKEYLSEFWYTAKAFKNLKVEVADGSDYSMLMRLIWEDLLTKLNKKTREKVVPYPRFLSLLLEHKMEGYGSKNVTLNPTQVFSVHNWTLKKNQPEGPPFTNHMLAICKAEFLVEHKAPNASSYTRKKDSKGKILELNLDISSNQILLNITLCPRLRQPKDQQATSGPTSLGVTSEGGANPQLSSAKSKAGADSGISTPKDLISQTIEKTKSVSEGLETILTQPTTGKGTNNIAQKIKEEELDSLNDDEPIIIQDESDKEVHAEKVQSKKPKETDDASATHPPTPKFIQIPKLTNQVLLLQKSLPTELKELPSKFNDLSGEIKKSKKYVEKLEVELPRDLKEIPNKLDKFTTTVSSLTIQVAELKTLQWELLAEFLSIPGQVSLFRLKSRPWMLFQVFSPRRAQSKITNCDILTRKGPITLKVYREDVNHEVITNFKASDLHLSEWREVVKACLNRKGAGWSTIYRQIKTRMDYLHKTKAELGIDLEKPLQEQEPFGRLNELTRKKRKHVDDIHNVFRSTKKYKSSVQYEDLPARTVLNEPSL